MGRPRKNEIPKKATSYRRVSLRDMRPGQHEISISYSVTINYNIEAEDRFEALNIAMRKDFQKYLTIPVNANCDELVGKQFLHKKNGYTNRILNIKKPVTYELKNPIGIDKLKIGRIYDEDLKDGTK